LQLEGFLSSGPDGRHCWSREIYHPVLGAQESRETRARPETAGVALDRLRARWTRVRGQYRPRIWRAAVSILRFTDGVEIDTSGEYRTLKLRDGWYVVGHESLRPCTDEEEANTVKDELCAISDASDTQILSRRSAGSKAPKFPNVHVQLSGEDGNVFSIIGRVRQALVGAGASPDDVQAFADEVMEAGSYDDALRAVMRWVDAS
jgi:hypothetical protein